MRDTSPAEQAGHDLGERLRSIRKSAELSGRALAGKLGWDPSKLSRLENGLRPPSPADIRAICEACGAPDQRDDLLIAARAVKDMHADWPTALRAGMQQSQAGRLRNYRDARSLRLYEPSLVPGLLQTADYARAVIGSFLALNGIPGDVDEAVAARLEWHKIIDGKREIHAVLEEQALRTRVGPKGVLAGQLDRLLAIGPAVRLAIIPAGGDRAILPVAGFAVFDRKLVQSETASAQVTTTRPTEIALFLGRFEALARIAVTGPDARRLLARARADTLP
jgi:transcriptional regulator with XRE-family HTH domain